MGWIGQPHLHKNLQQCFGTLTNVIKIPKTPSPLGFHAIRPTTKTSKNDDKTQKVFRGRIRMLLYLAKQGTVKVEFVRSQENDSDLFTKNISGETFKEHRRKMVWMETEYEWAAQDSTTVRVLEDVAHLPKMTSPYLLKMTSPYLLRMTSPYHIESHFNKTEKEKGKGQKALDSSVNQCGALVREAEDEENKQLLVNSIL